MVIDSSAIVAILFGEPEEELFGQLIEDDSVRLVSAVTKVEVAMVVETRLKEAGRAKLERFYALARLEIVPISPELADLAIEAFRRYGKGHHQAALNFGDCFSYALAKSTRERLLFKGNDFGLTDIAIVAHN